MFRLGVVVGRDRLKLNSYFSSFLLKLLDTGLFDLPGKLSLLLLLDYQPSY